MSCREIDADCMHLAWLHANILRCVYMVCYVTICPSNKYRRCLNTPNPLPSTPSMLPAAVLYGRKVDE
eukprot:scaffold153714_cov48-Prasinocladus_malaysianus.AAC.1